MRLSLRFVLPLLLVLAVLAYAVMPLVDQLTLRWFVRDLDIRASLIANAIAEPLQTRMKPDASQSLAAYFERITQDERLYALGFCTDREAIVVGSALLPSEIRCGNLGHFEVEGGRVIDAGAGALHVSIRPLAPAAQGPLHGQLILIHDLSFAARRSEETRRYVFLFFVALAVTVSLLTVVIAQLSWRGWVLGMRALLRGEGLLRRPEDPLEAPEFQPIASDLRRLLADLDREHHTRDEAQITWSPEALRRILQGELRGEDVIVVSNREPYIHQRRGEEVVVQQPASGLVTALEPIMRACSGTWIAHGSGSADREMCDDGDRVSVPPGNPAYQIRRVWLSQQEELGFYYGFSNEGLWPLCHIAHVRPTFRSADWEQYEAVNRKFAQAVLQEAKTDMPIVLVQDYHFALLPKMVRDILPNATVITFWHIPWPNPESFSICPWRERIVAGMLGSSILGFHTQAHCNNFVDTVDRLLEARVDREMFRVRHGGMDTAVRRYPISIEWPPRADLLLKPVDECRRHTRQQNNLRQDTLMGVGVDRLDYTKGIIERLRAVERLLDLCPEWVGRFSFVQIAAPTRSSIGEYQQHEAEVRTLAMQINLRFAHADVPPIVLRIAHHDQLEVYEYFRSADLCFVSSLHDGMNLVAKEFVAARDDFAGVLVLSQFTGAARELPEALIVNPYDTDQCALALHAALTMDPQEQRQRMRLMRHLVSEFNVYRWAGRMLLDAAIMRRRERLPAVRVADSAPGGPQ